MHIFVIALISYIYNTKKIFVASINTNATKKLYNLQWLYQYSRKYVASWGNQIADDMVWYRDVFDIHI